MSQINYESPEKPVGSDTRDYLSHLDDAETLSACKESIFQAWEIKVRQSIPGAQTCSSKQLRNSLPRLFDWLIRKLSIEESSSEDRKFETELAFQHAQGRMNAPLFDISEIIKEYEIFRRLLFKFLDEKGPITIKTRDIILSTIDQAIQNAAARFVELRNSQKETDQKRLAESEAQARQIANSLPLIVWTATPEGLVDWYNEWWYNYIGQSHLTQGEHENIQTMHPDDQKLTQILWPETVAQGQDFHMEQRFRRGSDGMYRWHLVRGVPIRDSTGRLIKYIGGCTDIHDQKTLAEELERAKNDLEKNSKLLETVLRQMPTGVVFAEAPSGRLVFANEQLKKVWRHEFIPPNNTTEYSKYIAFHPDGRRYEGHDWPLARALATGEVIKNEDTEVLLGDGTRGVIRISAAPVKNRKDEIIGGVALSEDVTAQVQSRKNLEASEARSKDAKSLAEAANSAKSSFLANMSHEIRTPMTAVLGFTEVLRDPNLTVEERLSAISRIDNSGRALLTLIEDILDISKIEAGKLEITSSPFSPAALVAEVISLLRLSAEKKGIDLKLIMDTSVPARATADASRLRQILLNLIGNAIKFTKKGGVTVVVKAEQNKDLIFDICDTGIGINEENREKLFQPFAQADGTITRKFGGSGLGLILSRHLAEKMGGHLWLADSSLGHGSRFTFKIQADPFDFEFGENDGTLSHGSPTLSPQDLEENLNGYQLLIAEDVAENRELMKIYLGKAGASIDFAENGKEAIELAQNKSYDLILMDIQMPIMDGILATQKLRARGYNGPIVALTAHAMAEEIERSKAAGCEAHLTKPLTRKTLIKSVQEYSRKS